MGELAGPLSPPGAEGAKGWILGVGNSKWHPGGEAALLRCGEVLRTPPQFTAEPEGAPGALGMLQAGCETTRAWSFCGTELMCGCLGHLSPF